MKKFFKYGVVPAAVGGFLLSITVMLLPVLVNVQQFLPRIEQYVTQTTGRPFSVGSDFGLTFFPWLSVTFSDMRLGNPAGTIAGDCIKIDSFEARVKLLPLLANKVEVSRFVVSGLDINLQREQDGTNNWQSFSKNDGPDLRQGISSKVRWLFSKEFFIELFAVTGGNITWSDREHNSDLQIDDMMVLLNNISSKGAAEVDFKATANGHQVRGTGSVGPVSSSLNSLFMDLRLHVNDRLEANVKGDCSYPLDKTQCDLGIKIPTFSLAALYAVGEDGKGVSIPEGGVGKAIALDGHFLGNWQKFTIDSGSGVIDDTAFSYSVTHDPATPTPNTVELSFTQLDLDHYFDGQQTKITKAEPALACPLLESIQSAPYTITAKAGEVKLADIRFANVHMDTNVDKGIMKVHKGTFDLHGGKGMFDATIGLTNQPISLTSSLVLQEVETGPFSEELMGVPFLSGPMQGQVTLQRSGVPGSDLGKAFIGEGTIQIDGGTISGIDLFSNNIPAAEKKTEFSQLSATLKMGAGVVRMQPLTLVGAGGKTVMSGVVQLADKSFSLSPVEDTTKDESLSLSGRYGADGLAVVGFTDIHETKVHELRDAETLVDEKMPRPTEEDVNNVVGTPLIDPAIVARRFGLKPEMIAPEKVKKAYQVGKGRIKINALQELNSPAFLD